MVRAVLLDVGGVILEEEELYSAYLAMLKGALSDHGTSVTDGEYDEAVRAAILSFVPALSKAVVWRFTRPDRERYRAILCDFRQSFAESGARSPRELCPGIDSALHALAQSHVLALAGNASSAVREVLEQLGVLHHFSHAEVSEDIGVSKPDVRFFEHILKQCDVPPADAVMVGDRLDNDIIPAKVLGMKTILVKVGPYSILEPRTPDEIPDVIIVSADELPDAIAGLRP
jgi:HAD superfamily hydrolase (TIGR01549 family)